MGSLKDQAKKNKEKEKEVKKPIFGDKKNV
jgi:hypothetical protein